MAQPVGLWCRPRVARRARLMALARVKMSARCVFGRGSGRYGRLLPGTQNDHDGVAFGEDEQLALVCMLTRWCSR